MAQTIVVPGGDRLEFPDGMADADIEKAIFAEYPDLAPKAGVFDRIKSALTPSADRAPMPSTSETINAPSGEFDTGATAATEGAISMPGSVMDGYVPQENDRGVSADSGMGPMRQSFYDETRAGLLSAPIQSHAAAAQAGGQVGKVAADSLPGRIDRAERELAGDPRAATQQEFIDDAGMGRVSPDGELTSGEVMGMAREARAGQRPGEKPEGFEVFTNAVMRGIHNNSAMLSGLAAAGAKAVGADDLSLSLLKETFSAQAAAGKYSAQIKDFTHIERLSDIPTYALEGIVENAPQLIGSIGSGVIGGVISKQLGAKAVAGMVREQAQKELMKRIALGSAAGAGAASIGMETGSIYGDIASETGEQRPGVAGAFGLVAGALDAIPAFRAARTVLGDAMAKQVAAGVVKRYGKEALIQLGSEGGTEFVQTLIEKGAVSYVDGRPVFTEKNMIEAVDAMLKGGIAGAAMGVGSMGVSDARQAVENRTGDLATGRDFNQDAIDAAARQALNPANAQIERSGGLLSTPIAPRATPADVANAETPEAAAAAIADMGAGIAPPATDAIISAQADIDAILAEPILEAAAAEIPAVQVPEAIASAATDFISQEANGRWALSRPIANQPPEVVASIIAELDRLNAGTPLQADSPAAAVQGLPQAAPETGAVPGELTPAPNATAVAQVEPATEGTDPVEQGAVGMKLATGQIVRTSSGRETTPFPKFSTATGGMNQSHLRAVDAWLLQNARDEAAARGDEFNRGQFDATHYDIVNRKRAASQADKDSAEEYLFGQQPDVPRPLLKPLVPASAAPDQQADADLDAALGDFGDIIGATAAAQPAAPMQSIERIKGGKLRISGYQQDDVSGSLPKEIAPLVTIKADGNALTVTMKDGSKMPIRTENAIKKALTGAGSTKAPKPRQYTGNLRNDVNLIAPGLYAEVARGGDGEGLDGFDMSLIAEKLRGEGFMLPTTETGKDSDAVIEIIRQDIANGGGTLNERRTTEAVDEEATKAHRSEILRLADEYGIPVRNGIIHRKTDDIEADVKAAIEADVGPAGERYSSLRADLLDAGVDEGDLATIEDPIADEYGDQGTYGMSQMFRRLYNELKKEFGDALEKREGRAAEGEATGGNLPTGESLDQFRLEAQTEAEARAEAERLAGIEDARLKAEQDAERKRQADAELPDFRLTGSDRPADTLAAQGQTDIFSAPAQPRPDRGEVGASLTKEQRKAVLKTLVDVYKGVAPKESKGFDNDGNERFGYAYSPELFVKSDITGAMVRYHVTLPDGRIAHPTELFADYTQTQIDDALAKQRADERLEAENRKDRIETLERGKADDVGEANRLFWQRNRGGNITPEETALLTDGTQFIRTLAVRAERDLGLLGGDWKLKPLNIPANLIESAANDAIKDLINQGPMPRGGLPAVQQQLFVEFGGQSFPVESLRDASEKWERFRDETNVGSSEVENLRILDQNGKQIAYVSYNGKVWSGSDYAPDAEPLYVPVDQRENRSQQGVNERKTDAKGNPIYKLGDRVEYISGGYEGRHGAISQVMPIAMRTVMVFSGAESKSETTYYYHVKTDNGADFMANPEEIRDETEKPDSVVPDITVDGMVMEPRRVFDGIGYAKRSAEGARAAAQRARKASSIADHKRTAERNDAKAAEYQAAWDAWAEKYPEEAEKVSPKPAPKGLPAAKVPVSGDALKDAGLTVTKTTTKNGKPVWEVGGNTKEHSDMLKRIGGRWYGPKKVWSFYNDDPTAAISEKLGGAKPAAPAIDLAENEVQLPDSPYVYRKEQNGWTWRVAGSDPVRANNLAPAAPIIEQLEADLARKNPKIMGRPVIDLPDTTLENLADQESAAGEKARAELEARDKADEVDLGQLFDEVLAEETGAKQDSFTENVAGVTGALQQKAQRERTAGQAAASAAINAGKGLADAIDGLGKLFGSNGSRLSSGLTFDEDTYAKAKPLFTQAVAHFKDAGADLKEAMRAVVRLVMDKFGPQVTENMKPYIVRFMEDVKAGNVVYDEKQEAVENGNDGTRPATAGTGSGGQRDGGTGAAADGRPGGRAEAGNRAGDRGDGDRRDGSGKPLGAVAEEAAGAGTSGQPAGDDQGRGGSVATGEGTRGSEPLAGGDRDPANVRDRPERPAAGSVAGNKPSKAPSTEGVSVSGKADFQISEDDALGEGGQKTKARNNIAAIRLLKKLAADDRRATPAEQKVLAKYVGWGGIKQIFDDAKADWTKDRNDLKALLTPEEYAAARRSMLDAHYTSMDVVSGMWSAAAHLGFKGGRVLEPSVGVGNFFGLMPADVRARSSLYGVELDNITAQLAQNLYPSATVANMGFQDVELPSNSFDLVVGNPPFGKQALYDKNHPELRSFSIHNFFFAKALDKLRPGGILQMVVSHHLMDAVDSTARDYITARADLIGAIRLPDNAFRSNAGTDVVTDIIFLKKREPGAAPAGFDWSGTKAITLTHPKTGERFDFRINGYYDAHPEMIVGDQVPTGKMNNAPNAYNVEAKAGESLYEGLGRAVAALPRNVMTDSTKPLVEIATAESEVPEGTKVLGYYMAGSVVMQRQPDAMGKRQGRPVEFKDAKSPRRAEAMIKVRNALRDLMRAERADETDAVLATKRTRLNTLYDAFKKEYGYINQPTNRRAFRDDPDLPLLESLEPKFDPGLGADAAKKRGETARKPTAEKADIFTKRVLPAIKEVTTAATAQDALVVSLNMKGEVDPDYMVELYGKPWEQIRTELGALVFHNPNGGWEAADGYLSGNVKAKLKTAEAAAEVDPQYQPNVEALRAVIPADVPALKISVRLGSPWIPSDVMEKLAAELWGDAGASIKFVKQVARWAVRSEGGDQTARNSIWGVTYGKLNGGQGTFTAPMIFEHVANNKAIVIKENVGDSEHPVWRTNEPATEAIRAKAQEMAAKFKEWIWQDQDRRDRLAAIYNENYNTDRRRSYDGSHLTLPGSSSLIKLRRHQLNAVWRAIQDRVILLDHVVGAGKTYEMAAIAMELRRLGFSRKPMFVVPNSLVRQWRDEFYKLYPDANVLAATESDFEKKNRKRFMAKIATGDWDAVIVAHSSFKKVGMPYETEKAILDEQLKEISDAIEDMKRERGDKNVVRDMERIKIKLEERMKSLKDSGGKKDDAVSFDELGVDGLFVDEAHLFKNLFYYSQMRNVTGLGNPNGSGRAFDLFVKTRYLDQQYSGKALIGFATGTPVSNSLVEMFTMQRYLAWNKLKENGLHLLDAWAGVYGDVQQVYEVHPSGTGYRLSTRFAKFVNLPSLMELYRGFADVITMDDLKQQAKDAGGVFPVPKIKGLRPRNIVAERSDEQRMFFGVPEFGRDDKGAIAFKYPADLNVRLSDKDGKWYPWLPSGGKVGAEGFDTEEQATAERDTLIKLPVVGWNSGSILWKFENLKELTKNSKGKINALSITNEARKAGLDYRLINPMAPDFPGSKINLAVKEAVRIYRDWSADKGAQLMFCDLSVPKTARAAAASKERDAYVRNSDGSLMMVKATVVTIEGVDASFLSVKDAVRGKDQHALYRIYDGLTGAWTGIVSEHSKAVAVSSLKDRLDDFGLAWLEDKRSRYSEITDADIADYKDAQGKEDDAADDEGDDGAISVSELMALAGGNTFSVYDDIKTKLIAAGIPENEIAFIHDFDTAIKKNGLFKKVKAGEIRILLGSTEKMGAGMNVQERLVALHHLDAPWRPSDLEQREGRIIRQGNKLYERDPDGFEVEVMRYGTRQTYDTRMWQIIEHKAAGVEQLRKAGDDLLEIDDVGGEAANAADMKAAASGNPLILDEIKLRNEAKSLEAQQFAYIQSKASMQDKVRWYRGAPDRAETQIAEIQPFVDAAEKNPADPFSYTTPDGKVLTDKKDVALPLTTAFADAAQSKLGDTIDAGQYRGLLLRFRKGMGGIVAYLGSGAKPMPAADYGIEDKFSPSGIFTRLDNALDRVKKTIADHRRMADQAVEQIPKLEAEIAKPFAKEDALKDARARHREVVSKLQKAGGGIELTPAMRTELDQAIAERTGAIADPSSAAPGQFTSPRLGNKFANASEAVEWLAQNMDGDGYRHVAQKILPFLRGVPIHYVSVGDTVPAKVAELLSSGSAAVAYQAGDIADGKDAIYVLEGKGDTEEGLLHEALHIATSRRLIDATAAAEFSDMAKVIRSSLYDAGYKSTDQKFKQAVEFFRREFRSPGELVAYGFSSPAFQDLLKLMAADGKFYTDYRTPEQLAKVNKNASFQPQKRIPAPAYSMWHRFVDAVRALFGGPKAYQEAYERATAANAAIDRNNELASRVEFETLEEKLNSLLDALLQRPELSFSQGGAAQPIRSPRGQSAVDTSSPEFKRWFGDSKVVDAEGKPLRVYHGTRGDFAEFDHDMNERLPGFWFTPDPEAASAYAASGLVNASMVPDANVMPVYVSLKNPRIYTVGKEAYGNAWNDYETGSYDGFIMVADGQIKAVVAKDDTQIKSAISNTGEFSDENPSILNDVSADQNSAISRAIDRAIALELGQEVAPLRRVVARRKIGKLRTQLEAGEISEAVFIEKVEQLHADMEEAFQARQLAPHKGRARGADYIRQKLLEAKRRGDIGEEAADFAEWFIIKNPDLVDNLGISLRTKETRSAGNYNPMNRVMTLFKGQASDTTAVHEILHHMERMMPADMQEAIRLEWIKQVTKELTKEQKVGDQQRIAYFEAVLAGDQKKAMEILTGEALDGLNSAVQDSAYGLLDQPSGDRTLDAATLRDLRREAAGLEQPEKGKFLTVTADGLAVTYGEPRTKIPESFVRFAAKHGLTLSARRVTAGQRGSSEGVGKALGDMSVGGGMRATISNLSQPMPIEYRESGAAYFGESGKYIDRTGRTRYDLDIGSDYRYLNPSEFWAVSMTEVVAARFVAKNSIWARSRQWLVEAIHHIKAVLGLNSKHPMIKALDAISKGDGSFVSKGMLGSSDTYAAPPRQQQIPGTAAPTVPPPPTRQMPAPLQGGGRGNNASWNALPDTKLDDVIRVLQDKHIDSKRAVQAIKAAGRQVADKWNVYEQETKFHGRAAKRTLEFVETELTPLAKDLAMRGLTLAELEEYLHARHAPEANALIAQRNPAIPDGGSGMTNQQAADYFSNLDPSKRRRLAASAVRVDAIIAATRQAYVSYGLVSQDTVNGWAATFQHYIPLMREDKDGAMGIGQGFSIKGKESKSRTGSTRAVVDILANIAMQRERAITRGEKNRVSVSLLGLAKLNPNPDFWTVDRVPMIVGLNPATGLVESHPDPNYKNRENVVVAKVPDGKGGVQERAVVFAEDNDQAIKMALALRNLDVEPLKALMGVAATVTRYFASINTQYNPVFGVANLFRDTQEAMLNLGSTPIAGHQADVLKHTLGALRGIYIDTRQMRKGQPATSSYAQLWEEFQHEGGQTGYREMFRTSADRAKAIERAINPHRWMDSNLGQFFTAAGTLKVPMKVAQDGAAWLFDWLSDYNEAMENAVRLSAYKVGIDNGMSKHQAIVMAKGLTVNFNRKGQIAQQAGAFHAFFNASMQGTGRLAQTLFTMQGNDIKTARLSKLGMKIVAGGILWGSLQALMLMAAGFGDDDPPEFVREKNTIIPWKAVTLGLVDTKQYTTIPMPLGFAIFPNIGRLATEFVMGGFKNPGKYMVKILGIMADAFNPIGGNGTVMQMITPTALDPLAALSENKDWTKKPIAKVSYDKTKPGFALWKDTASTPSKMIAEAINSLSGGTKYVAGSLSPTPDQIDYLFGQVTGGVGRELGKLEQSVVATATGDELPPHKIPLVGRFYGNSDASSSQGTTFYNTIQRMNEHEATIKGLRKDGKGAEAAQYIADNPEARLVMRANHVERQVQKMRKEKHDLIEKGATRERVKAVEERIKVDMRRFNEAIEALKKRQKEAA